MELISTLGNWVNTSFLLLFNGSFSLFQIAKQIPYLGPIISYLCGWIFEIPKNMPLEQQARYTIGLIKEHSKHNHPQFSYLTYGKTLEIARSQLKLLFIYLHAPLVPSCQQFCTQILTTPSELNQNSPTNSSNSDLPQPSSSNLESVRDTRPSLVSPESDIPSESSSEQPKSSTESFTNQSKSLSESEPLKSLYPETSKFLSGNGELAKFLHENDYISWAGSIDTTEGLAIAKAFRISEFPAVAVLASLNRTDRVILRLQGFQTNRRLASSGNNLIKGQIPSTQDKFIECLKTVTRQSIPFFGPARQRRALQEQERMLKIIQEQEFQLARQKDIERKKQLQIEKQEQINRQNSRERRAIEKKARQLKRKERWDQRMSLRSKMSIPPEPAPCTSGPQASTKLRITFPDGTRVSRLFLQSDTIETVLQFSDLTKSLNAEHLQLVSLPTIYEDHSQTLLSAGLVPRAAVHVQYREDIDLEEIQSAIPGYSSGAGLSTTSEDESDEDTLKKS